MTDIPEERRAKVLIVDDDARIRKVLRRMLESEGYELFEGKDGEEALVLAEAEEPDLILLDVLMPTLSGFDVCRRLKAMEAFRMTPVVLITGLSDVENRVVGIQAGADDFISKPFENTELLARVKSLLRMKSYTDELERAETVLFTLARAIEERDHYTRGHCDRLARYAEALGGRMGLGQEAQKALHLGGIVHDIGKVSVPDAILNKRGPLTEAEREMVQVHPEAGVRICQPLKSFRSVLPIVRSHHERMDGSGYPDGLKGEEIPITARILAVVDVYDALTTDRPYRDASPPDRALEILQDEAERGWWDPKVLDAFREMVREGLPPAPD
jgi:putative two-component system response regulator